MNDKPCFLVNNRRPFIVSLTFWVWLDVRYENKNVALNLYLRKKKGFSGYFFIGSKSIRIWIQTSHLTRENNDFSLCVCEKYFWIKRRNLDLIYPQGE